MQDASIELGSPGFTKFREPKAIAKGIHIRNKKINAKLQVYKKLHN